jgi:hypothetical protein
MTTKSRMRTSAQSWGERYVLGALVLASALGFLMAAAPHAKAATISQPSTATVSGLEVTGCVDIRAASTKSGTPVDFYPCNGGANEQWAYTAQGTIIGLGNNCLTDVKGLAVIKPCTGASSQLWTINHENGQIERGSDCLNSTNLGGPNDQLTVAACNGTAWVLQ